jgi:hypothetical protein
MSNFQLFIIVDGPPPYLGIFCSQVANGLFCGGSARLLGVQMLLAVSIIGWSLVTQR